jgi:hypothetical protein
MPQTINRAPESTAAIFLRAMMKGLLNTLGFGLAMALLGLTLAACGNCEASGHNGGGSGMCGLTQNF